MSCAITEDTLEAIVGTLEVIADEHTGKRAQKAESLLNNLKHSMIICLVMFKVILKKTKLLSDALQSPSLNLSAAADMVQSVEDDIRK